MNWQPSTLSVRELSLKAVSYTHLFRQKAVDEISENIVYPLKRTSPIPSVENAEELNERFDSIFDEDLISIITTLSHWGMFFGGGDRDRNSSSAIVGLAMMILAPLAAGIIQMEMCIRDSS